MGKARVLQRSFINNRIVEPDEVIEYDGPFGDNIEPVKEERAAQKPAPKPEPAAPSK